MSHENTTPWSEQASVPGAVHQADQLPGPLAPSATPSTSSANSPTPLAAQLDLAAQRWLQFSQPNVQELQIQRKAFCEAVYRVCGVDIMERAGYGYDTELTALLRSSTVYSVPLSTSMDIQVDCWDHEGRVRADEYWKRYGEQAFTYNIDETLNLFIRTLGHTWAPEECQDALRCRLLAHMVSALKQKQMRVFVSCLLAGSQ